MPPQIQRPETAFHQTASHQDARIGKHLFLARAFWAKWPGYLAKGDLYRARANGWSAVAELATALAIRRGWEYCDHDAIRDTVTALAHEMPSEEQTLAVLRGLWAAESLHGKFYEVAMNPELAKYAFADVQPLLSILWNLLPDEYTGGVSFDEWMDEGR